MLFACLCALLLSNPSATVAQEEAGEENASNPLSAVTNTDIRWQYFDVDGSRHINDFFIDGAFMAHPKLKIKYELHYWETNITGSSEDDWESFVVKPIFFPAEGVWGDLKYRLAVGVDWIVDLGDKDKGTGSGSDQIAPFAGVALGLPDGLMLIPLVQHFMDYSGEDVSTTAFRLIALKPLPAAMWVKLDAKFPIDWEDDEALPVTAELQLGKNISEAIAVYVDALVGIGGDRPYDWGVGTGLRFKY